MAKLYAQDGVNIAEGDSFSSFAGALCKTTYENSPYVEIKDFSRGHFRGPRGFRFINLPDDCWFDASPDGEGTKVTLIDAAQAWLSGGNGIVAMTCGDITRWGGLPLLIINNFDVSSLGEINSPENLAARMLMHGLKRACDQQGIVMYKGETAELSSCVGSENPNAILKYLWSAVAIGAFRESTIITGDEISDGMDILALREPSGRNNGYSSIRKAGHQKYVDFYSDPDAIDFLSAAAAPATLYDRFLAYANGWFSPDGKPKIPVKLLVHVTGGSIKSKLGEDILFPRNLSADLPDLWDPPEFLKKAKEWRGMSDEEAYEVWCNGNGVLAIMNPIYSSMFIALGKKYGVQIKIAGKIKKRKRVSVTLRSGYSGEKIIYGR
jgi:phosphoribosylaminoimidazole (AIR) synthetase